MDKKKIAGIIEELVAAVMVANTAPDGNLTVDEGTARGLLASAILGAKNEIVRVCTISKPTVS